MYRLPILYKDAGHEYSSIAKLRLMYFANRMHQLLSNWTDFANHSDFFVY